MEKRKRLAALLCAVIMALTLLPVQAWAAGEGGAAFSFASTALELDDGAATLYDDAGDEAEFVPETDPYFDHGTVTRYGRTTLAQEQNSEALLDVYDALVICAVVTNLPQDYVVLENGVDKDTFVLAAQAFRADYPELFWAVPASMYLPDDPNHYIAVSLQRWSDFAPDENGSDAYLTNKKREFLANVESLLDGLPAGSDYDKELYLHDRLIERTEYDSEYEEQQSAFSVVMEGRGVCAGYAFAFQYLLMRAGIESYYVVGTAGEDENGDPVGHAWNIAKIGGVWYYVDPTWDDSDDEYAPYHAYFNLNTKLLTRDHVLDPYPYNVTLPQCNELRWFYHRYNGTEVFAGDNDLASTIAIWINYYKGAAHLYMNDADPTYLGTWFAQNHQKVAEAMGITGPYRYGIAWCGPEYVLSLETVSDDLNGDDSVDILDVQVLYAYLTTGVFSASDTSLDEDTFLKWADINGDGAIDVYDLQALYEIVCGIG